MRKGETKQRYVNGKLKSGCDPLPGGGRPKDKTGPTGAQLLSKLRAAIAGKNAENITAIGKMLVRLALEGNLEAAKIALKYTVPTPREMEEVIDPKEVFAAANIVERVQRIIKRSGNKQSNI